MRIGLVPIIAAAALAIAGCGQAPANNAANSAGSGTASSSGGAASGGVCGGIGNVQCAAATDFCDMPAGQCGGADAQGACTARPGACTQPYRPVCGCNGRTYGNACQAAVAGTSVQAEGACPETAGSDANSAAAQ